MLAAIWFVPFFASIFVVGVSASTAVIAEQPYQVVKPAAVVRTGGFDYVFADADGRKLYIPRGNRVDVYDLDTLMSALTKLDRMQR